MKTLHLKRYPLLKFLVPLAALVFAFGLFMFFNQADADAQTPGQQLNPLVLLPYIAVSVGLAFAGLLWKQEEDVTLLLPSDTLVGKSRGELQRVLDGLEEAKAKGELDQARYEKAKARVLKAMK